MKHEVYIATHKAYDFPCIEPYIPIHVGKENSLLDLGIIGDNTGDHISHLNSSFCELTALYWMWKNSEAKILGLVHYRRYFVNQQGELLTTNDISQLAENHIWVAKRNQFFKVKKFFGLRFSKKAISVKEHYEKDHYLADFMLLRQIIEKNSPEYIKAFDCLSNSIKGISLFNMFVMHKIWLDKYCNWMFKILFELEKELDISSYNSYQKRIFGFLSERLFNVFLLHHNNEIKVSEIDVVMK